MSLLDFFRKKNEPYAAEPYASPIQPIPPSQPPKEEVIKYMTENPHIPDKVKDDKWGWDVQHLSFSQVKGERDRVDILRQYDYTEKVIENFKPKIEIFKPEVEEGLASLQYKSVIDLSLRRAENGQFLRSMTAAVNVVETKTQSGPIQPPEPKRRGGILGFLGI